MADNLDKDQLHPALQKLATYWPLIGGAFTAVAFALSASAQISTNKDDIGSVKGRLDRLEASIPAIREDLAAIKQQNTDNGDRLKGIERRLDDDRRSR